VGERAPGKVDEVMHYGRLGSTGLEISRIWLGMMSYGSPGWRDWVLDEDAAQPFVKRALDLGINAFDTADVYSAGRSEEITGNLLRRHARRDEIVIATKLFFPLRRGPNGKGLSRKRVLDSVDASLRRLGVDYIDVYQIHRWDSHTPVAETMSALHDVVKAGKVRYIGASSMSAWQFAKAQHTAAMHGWTQFSSMQCHYNLLYREEEREMLPQCADLGVGVLAWSPLARGRLARPNDEATASTRGNSDVSSRRYYVTPPQRAIVDRLGAVAEDLGITRAQAALAWLLLRPGLSAPIVGATKIEQLEQAVAALDVTLSPDQVQSLEERYEPQEVRGH
jgi:aryl-alcohol dehydrogenase-like predicted oxidoreductase